VGAGPTNKKFYWCRPIKSSIGQPGFLIKSNVGSGAMEEKHPLVTGHTCGEPLVEIRYTGSHVKNWGSVSQEVLHDKILSLLKLLRLSAPGASKTRCGKYCV
jgi:hypothetical protein